MGVRLMGPGVLGLCGSKVLARSMVRGSVELTLALAQLFLLLHFGHQALSLRDCVYGVSRGGVCPQRTGEFRVLDKEGAPDHHAEVGVFRRLAS